MPNHLAGIGRGAKGRGIDSQSQREAEEGARERSYVRPRRRGAALRRSQWAGARREGARGAGGSGAEGMCSTLLGPLQSAYERVTSCPGQGAGANAARASAAAAVTIPAGKPAALARARWWLERGEGWGGYRRRAAPRRFVLRELMNEAVPPRPGGLSQDVLGCVLMEPSDGELWVRAPESVLGIRPSYCNAFATARERCV